jgi:hypothetical protein
MKEDIENKNHTVFSSQAKKKQAMPTNFSLSWNELTTLLTSLDSQILHKSETLILLLTLFISTVTILTGIRFCSKRKESTRIKDEIIEFPKLPDDVVSYKKTKIFDEVDISLIQFLLVLNHIQRTPFLQDFVKRTLQPRECGLNFMFFQDD